MKTLDFIKLDESKVSGIFDSLQQLLADYQIYYANLRGFHWNIKGHDFFVLHSKFEEMYDDTAEKIDAIAARILQLGGTPANKYRDYLKTAQVKEIDNVCNGEKALQNVLETIAHFVGEERKLIAAASEVNDEVTVSILTGYLEEQEKLIWMLTAYINK